MVTLARGKPRFGTRHAHNVDVRLAKGVRIHTTPSRCDVTRSRAAAAGALDTYLRMGDAPSPPNSLREWTTRQRAEQAANRFLSNAPFLGDRTGACSRKWNDTDPTWWSDVQNARLVRRSDMLVAIEKHQWRPRSLSSHEVDALKRVLRRPPTTRSGAARVARAPPSRVRGFDAPVHASAVPPSPKQPRIAFPAQIAKTALNTRGAEADERGD